MTPRERYAPLLMVLGAFGFGFGLAWMLKDVLPETCWPLC